MSRFAGPCLPPTPAILPSAMATSPEKAGLPVPSMIVPPRMTMSCMPASPWSRASKPRNLFLLDEVSPERGAGDQWLCRIPPLQKHYADSRKARRREVLQCTDGGEERHESA